MKDFSHTFSTNESPERVRRAALTDLAPGMGRSGFPLDHQDDYGLTFVNRYRSSWVILFCIIFFPIGLLALLAPKKVATVVMTIEPSEAGAQVTFTGKAHKSLRRQIESMNGDEDRGVTKAAGVEEPPP